MCDPLDEAEEGGAKVGEAKAGPEHATAGRNQAARSPTGRLGENGAVSPASVSIPFPPCCHVSPRLLTLVISMDGAGLETVPYQVDSTPGIDSDRIWAPTGAALCCSIVIPD